MADGNDLDINTFSGDVNLRLPDSARGNIDFNSFSGHFESDLPVTLTSSSRRNFRGALNGGGNGDFRLKTFSGDVTHPTLTQISEARSQICRSICDLRSPIDLQS